MSHHARLWRLFSILGALALAACGGGGGDPPDAAAPAAQLAAVRSGASPAAVAVGPATIVVKAAGTPAAGINPRMQLIIDGVVASPVDGVEVVGETPADYSFVAAALPGPGGHVDVVFLNDGVAVNGDVTEDRNLIVDSVTLGEGNVLLPTDTFVIYDRGEGAAAFDGANITLGQRGMWWSGALRIQLPTGPITSAGTVVVRARADLAGGVGAEMSVRVNGMRLHPAAVLVSNVGSSASYTFASEWPIPAGARVDVFFSNDALIQVDGVTQDRNLYVDWISIDGGPALGSSQPSVVLDRGLGEAAIDELDTLPGGPGMYWDAALRFIRPVIDEGPTDPARVVTVSARADLAGGVGALMEVRVAGVALTPEAVMVDNTTEFQDYRFRAPAALTANSAVDVIFHNDAVIDGEDRNLFVRSVTLGTVATLDPASAAYDTGEGASAFDGLVVFTGREAMVWAGALRFSAPPAPPASVAVIVNDIGSGTVPGARVSAGGVVATTDLAGRATLNGVAAGAELAVTIERDGYVTQAMRITPVGGETTPVAVRMLPVKSELVIDDIAQAQYLSDSALNTTIRLPANAFVRVSDNQPATGAARLQLTPWDVVGEDLIAMPGGARGLDRNGAYANLISYGMISADFVDATGARLQLAPGKFAVIEMDLPYGAAYDLRLGAVIPMWSFDAARGLWVEEGDGTVFAPTNGGRHRLRAEVTHFSTWNWDFKFDGGGSSFVRCVDTQGLSVACSVSARIELADGSQLMRGGALSAGGSQVINMPSSATINWEATSAGGFKGTAVTGVDPTVTITVSGVATRSPLVNCVLPDGSAIGCTVEATYALDSPSDAGDTVKATIPASGAQVRSAFGPAQSVGWRAKAQTSTPLPNGIREVTFYEVMVESSPPDEPTVTLTLQPLRTVESFSYVQVRCDSSVPAATPPTSATCSIQVRVYDSNTEGLLVSISLDDVATDTTYRVGLPENGDTLDFFDIYGKIVDDNGTPHYGYPFRDADGVYVITWSLPTVN